MNDYYSDFPQPPPDTRAKNLVDVMIREQNFRDFFTPDELNTIALDVVKDSKEYSMSGYNVFGFREEKERFRTVLISHIREHF
jgi:hypothetical protein